MVSAYDNSKLSWSTIFFQSNILTSLDYRNAPSWLFSIYGLLGLANCIFLVLLFMWKKWAFFAYCGVVGIILMMDFVFSSYEILELLLSSALGLAGPSVLVGESSVQLRNS